jgi:hypothetical protein
MTRADLDRLAHKCDDEHESPAWFNCELHPYIPLAPDRVRPGVRLYCLGCLAPLVAFPEATIRLLPGDLTCAYCLLDVFGASYRYGSGLVVLTCSVCRRPRGEIVVP